MPNWANYNITVADHSGKTRVIAVRAISPGDAEYCVTFDTKRKCDKVKAGEVITRIKRED